MYWSTRIYLVLLFGACFALLGEWALSETPERLAPLEPETSELIAQPVAQEQLDPMTESPDAA